MSIPLSWPCNVTKCNRSSLLNTNRNFMAKQLPFFIHLSLTYILVVIMSSAVRLA